MLLSSDYSRFACNGYFHSYSKFDTDSFKYINKNKIDLPRELISLLDHRSRQIGSYINMSRYINEGDTRERTEESWQYYRRKAIEDENQLRENYKEFIDKLPEFNFTPTEKGGIPDGFEDQVGHYCTTCGHKKTMQEYLEDQEKVNAESPKIGVLKAGELYLDRCHHCQNGKTSYVNKHALKVHILDLEIEKLRERGAINEAAEKAKLKVKELQLIDPFYKDIYLGSLMEIGNDCVLICDAFEANRIRNEEAYQYAKMGLEAYQKAESNRAFLGEPHDYVRSVAFYLQSVTNSPNGSDDISVEKINALIEKARKYSDSGKRIYEQRFPQDLQYEINVCDRSMLLVYTSAALTAGELGYSERDIRGFISMIEEHIKTTRVFSQSEKREMLSWCDEMRAHYIGASGMNRGNISNI